MANELSEYGKLLESFKEREEATLLSQKTRRSQIESIYSDIIKRYEPGGAFGAGYESLIQRQKVKDVGATSQRDISRGLYGIRPYEAEWEATTGASARLRLEDIRMERLGGAQTGMAGFLERIEEPYPDYSSLFQASQAQGQEQAGGGGSSYGAYRPLPTLGGGGGGQTYAPGQSPLQQSLAQRNQAALAEREKRATWKGSTSETQSPKQAETADVVSQPTQAAQTAPDTAAIDDEYNKFVQAEYAKGSYVTSGTKKRWMKQQGYTS